VLTRSVLGDTQAQLYDVLGELADEVPATAFFAVPRGDEVVTVVVEPDRDRGRLPPVGTRPDGPRRLRAGHPLARPATRERTAGGWMGPGDGIRAHRRRTADGVRRTAARLTQPAHKVWEM
jgi:hypothetical protein